MKKVALLLFLALLCPTMAGAQPDTFVITAKALRDGRAFVRNIVISVPGIDLVGQGHPRYLRADDPAFAAREFDDSHWQPLDSLKDAGLVRGQVYWVRFVLGVDPKLANAPVDLGICTQGALEVFFNGELMERFGTMPAYGTGKGYQAADFVPRRHVRLRFAGDGRVETIAVRRVYAPMFLPSFEKANRLALTLHLPEVDGTIARMQDSTLLQYGMFLGINLIILLLAGVIMSRSKRDKSWMMLALFSLLMALVAFSNIPPKGDFGLSLNTVSVITMLNPLVYPLSILFLVVVMRALFATVDRRSMLLFGSLTLAMIIMSYWPYFDPTMDVGLDGWLTILFFFEVARQAIRAVRRKVHGSWIIGIGAVLFIVNGVFLEQFYQITGLEMVRWLRTFLRFSYYLTMPVTIAIFLAVRSAYHNRLLARQRDELDQEVHERTAELRHEKERSDELLLNILPEEVAEELKAKGAADAKLIDHVTVLFTDFKGFTTMSEKLTAKELVADIHECFSAFDHIVARHGIEKIKTIGDAYMAAGGLPTANTTHALDVVKAALEIRDFIAEGRARKVVAGLPYFEIRIGIHTGPVVAGIVGVKKFAYDIWGDTVNTASRMESSGEVGQVNVSEATYALVKDEPGLTFTPRGKVQAKGKGELEMYFVATS
ncbi:MAG: adenylate/guanylate cyclase domain-containing protein [Flavobacteriales bacterium]